MGLHFRMTPPKVDSVLRRVAVNPDQQSYTIIQGKKCENSRPDVQVTRCRVPEGIEQDTSPSNILMI